jgi:hypothetical protein
MYAYTQKEGKGYNFQDIFSKIYVPLMAFAIILYNAAQEKKII